MKNVFSRLVIPALIFLGSGDVLADEVRMRAGSGTIYNIYHEDRMPFHNAAKRDDK